MTEADSNSAVAVVLVRASALEVPRRHAHRGTGSAPPPRRRRRRTAARRSGRRSARVAHAGAETRPTEREDPRTGRRSRLRIPLDLDRPSRSAARGPRARCPARSRARGRRPRAPAAGPSRPSAPESRSGARARRAARRPRLAAAASTLVTTGSAARRRRPPRSSSGVIFVARRRHQRAVEGRRDRQRDRALGPAREAGLRTRARRRRHARRSRSARASCSWRATTVSPCAASRQAASTLAGCEAHDRRHRARRRPARPPA